MILFNRITLMKQEHEIHEQCKSIATILAKRFTEINKGDHRLIVIGNTPAYISQYLPREIPKINIPYSGKGINSLRDYSQQLIPGTRYSNDNTIYGPGYITPTIKI